MMAPRLCGSSTPSSTTTSCDEAAASRPAYLLAAPSADHATLNPPANAVGIRGAKDLGNAVACGGEAGYRSAVVSARSAEIGVHRDIRSIEGGDVRKAISVKVTNCGALNVGNANSKSGT